MPNANRDYWLDKKYSMSAQDYDILLEKQHGVCAICHDLPGERRALSVDHDHNTGFVRGLLCTKCNAGLGLFKDDIRLLAAAIVYLQDNE
jgi:Recombination endonuclease VII